MPQPAPRPAGFGLHVLAAILTAVTFVADLMLPLGVASGMPYAVLVLLGLRAAGPGFTVLAAAVGTNLTVLGAVLTTEGDSLWPSLDRGVTLVVIWTIAFVVLQQKKTERALRQERLESRGYLDVAQVAIVLLQRDGSVGMINRRGSEILGWEASEIVGRNWFESFIPEPDRQATREAFRALIAGHAEAVEYFENAVRTRNGEERLIAWRNAYIRDAKGAICGTLSSGEDITERRQAEEELTRSHKELADVKQALEQAAIVATTDARGIITYANDKFCEISKYDRDELLGQDHRIVNSGFHPKEFFADLWGTIASGGIWRGEIRNRAKDGAYYWVDTTIVPFVDGRGRPYRYMAIRSDITGRKQAETELRRQEALAQLGRMAAQVAHEVKNPLAGISGALQIIRRRLPPESQDQPVIDEILQRIDALNEWIQELLVFSRPRSPRFVKIRALPLLRETIALLDNDPQFNEVESELEGADLVLPGDRELLKSVFLNLVLNAAQAMNGQGRIRVRLAPRNGRCRISVEDDGPGIPREQRDRVFEPFFTTKSKGSGLGLAVAKQVVVAHGGEIEIACPEDGGTRVTVWLPMEVEEEFDLAPGTPER